MVDYYLKKGYSLDWIMLRFKAIIDRKKLTNEWQNSGIKENYEFAIASWKKPEREDIIKYLAAYMSCARPGNTYAMSDARLEPDNVALVAKSMYDYFKEMKHE